jgi:hypothetical protein
MIEKDLAREGQNEPETLIDTEAATEDDMTEEEIREKYLKRNAVTSDDVDLIMASRVKKWSIEVPIVPMPSHSTIRAAEISDEDMAHLLMEIKEGEFDKNAARPDLELLTVGKGARKEEASVYKRTAYMEAMRVYKEAKENPELTKEEKKKFKKPKKNATDVLLSNHPMGDISQGKGVEIPYDSARKVFVLSPTLEDRLLLLIRNDLPKASVVNQGVTFYGKANTVYSDRLYQRQWRRLLREHFLPKLQNEKRMVAIAKRLKAAKDKSKVKGKILTADEVEYSATDSDESEEEKPKKRKKKS